MTDSHELKYYRNKYHALLNNANLLRTRMLEKVNSMPTEEKFEVVQWIEFLRVAIKGND